MSELRERDACTPDLAGSGGAVSWEERLVQPRPLRVGSRVSPLPSEVAPLPSLEGHCCQIGLQRSSGHDKEQVSSHARRRGGPGPYVAVWEWVELSYTLSHNRDKMHPGYPLGRQGQGPIESSHSCAGKSLGPVRTNHPLDLSSMPLQFSGS